MMQANRTEVTARMNGCKTGGKGQRHLVMINKMRKAYYFYSISYVGAVCPDFTKCCIH